MTFGFAPDEIDTAASTRSARLKWVIVVDGSLPPGRAVNAAVCAAAATSAGVTGLLGPEAVDADGSVHVGLPWAGCSILAADRTALAAIRAKADAHAEVFVVDVPVAAQETRVYDEFLASVAEAGADAVEYLAVSLVGPRNRVDKIVGRLPLMP
ncbi:DUF2000 domain-containing protein [Rathayibacter sp. VKM Ac-2630]|uniref:DUF2000 domain-containing protein n=1 Tax=Rathayibacter sp. VKM Ac-2630 TaxID=1938617 RepID=UPI000980EC39|nr:DUF2000 domain-containing protein [Rathayibacter sp. VKM Ac-2630]OOB92414.1 hypothetical protein B0T42_00665 [Rathayibacter sp. VKM Ac-2630]